MPDPPRLADDAARGDARPLAQRSPWWLKLVFASVLLFLVAQLMLRQTRSEPFPTFLLPGGPSLYHTDSDGIVYQRTTYYAVGPDGAKQEIPIEAFLPGVPPSYHGPIVRDDFGLKREGPRRGPIRLGPLRLPTTGGVITKQEIAATQAWMRRHAEAETGGPVASIRAVRRAYRLRPFAEGEGEQLLRTVSDETIPLSPTAPDSLSSD